MADDKDAAAKAAAEAEAAKVAAEKAAADKAEAEKAEAEKAAADAAAAESEQPEGDVTVIVAVSISGLRNGEPWPAIGEPFTLPAAEAASYLQFGYVREVVPEEEPAAE